MLLRKQLSEVLHYKIMRSYIPSPTIDFEKYCKLSPDTQSNGLANIYAHRMEICWVAPKHLNFLRVLITRI